MERAQRVRLNNHLQGGEYEGKGGNLVDNGAMSH